MDGLLNLDKPAGLSSAKALYRVRKLIGVRKSGHAGTLDPTATGVLLIACGKGTKRVERLMGLPKVYRATARLDVTSFSYDSESPLEPVAVARPPELAEVRAALDALEGEIMQLPPAVSALKVGGVPAYRLARRGAAVELRPRPARIDWLHVHGYAWPTLDFEMCCGRGTYVRSVIRDVGTALGTGGCLTALRRTRIGPFGEADAVTLEALAGDAAPLGRVLRLAELDARLEDRAIPSRP